MMPRFSSKRRVHHSAPQMFDLVADVERYPEFVPLCHSLKIRQRTPQADGTEIVIADMTVSFKLMREILHQPGDAGPSQSENPGRISERAVQQSGEPLDLRGQIRAPIARSDFS